MNWADPLVLGLIPISLVLAWWLFRPTRAAVSASFANIRRLWADRRGLSDAAGVRRHRARGLLLGLGALLALVALARPQWGKVEAKSYEQAREVLLALDLSRSMLTEDVSPTRLDRAKLLIESLLDKLHGERVGLAVFAGTSFLQSPLSADYEMLRDFLRDLDPSYLPQGGTDYGAMMQTALKAFGQQGDGDRFLVILSDGEAHDEEWKSLVPAVKQKGIRVIGLGVGTTAGGLVPGVNGGVMKEENGAAVLSRLEPETLKQLAAETGGAYRDAATWVDIDELVKATVDQGRAGNYVDRKETRFIDRYQWCLAPALLLFLLSYWLEFPVLPVPRLVRRNRRVVAPVRAAAAAALAAALVLPNLASAATTQPPLPAMNAPVAENQDGAAAAPPVPSLESLVDEIASKPNRGAGDYERLATTTIDFASKPDAAPGPSRLGVIDDALLGVDEGEKIDAAAAKWPELRQQLEALKREQEKQQQQEQQNQPQQDSAQPQQNQGDDQKRDQQSGQGEQKPQDQQNAGEQKEEKQNSPGEQPQQASGENGRPKNDEMQAQGAAGAPQNEPEGEDQQEQAASAGEAPENAAEKEGEKHEGTRLVGGGPVQQQPTDGQDLAMVEALNRMERIKDGDSPSTLFERMNRAEGAPKPKNTGKNW